MQSVKTVTELRVFLELLEKRNKGGHNLVIPYERGTPTIGGKTCTSIKDISVGFDWDNGKVFLNPEVPLGINDDGLKLLKRQKHKVEETLAFVRMALEGRRLSDAHKIDAAMSHIKALYTKD